MNLKTMAETTPIQEKNFVIFTAKWQVKWAGLLWTNIQEKKEQFMPMETISTFLSIIIWIAFDKKDSQQKCESPFLCQRDA